MNFSGAQRQTDKLRLVRSSVVRRRVAGSLFVVAAFLVVPSGSHAGGIASQANSGLKAAGSAGDQQPAPRFSADTTLVLLSLIHI